MIHFSLYNWIKSVLIFVYWGSRYTMDYNDTIQFFDSRWITIA